VLAAVRTSVGANLLIAKQYLQNGSDGFFGRTGGHIHAGKVR